jgi:hypothetical protein
MTTALAGKQPLDSDLTAIAALTTTAFGRSLLTAADAAALRTLSGALAASAVGAANGAAGLDSSAHLPVAQLVASGTLTVQSTTSWPARPTSRTDVSVRWVDTGGLGTDPAGALDGDTVVTQS